MDFLSIADAAKLTDRHEKTIRRWIKKQFDSDPQAKEKIIQEALPSGFTYRIDRDYLLAHSPTHLDSPPEQGGEHAPGQGAEQGTGQRVQQPDPLIAAKDESITILKEQVGRQQEELTSKNEQIKTLMERLREQNILLKGYQDRYLLTGPKEHEEQDSTLDKAAGHVDGQSTVQSPGQGRQANPADADTNHEQKEQVEIKPRRKQLHKHKPKQSEQSTRRGFFSFFRRK